MKWQVAKINNKVFVYKNGEWEPTYKFERAHANAPYIGHGQQFGSQIAIEKWLERL